MKPFWVAWDPGNGELRHEFASAQRVLRRLRLQIAHRRTLHAIDWATKDVVAAVYGRPSRNDGDLLVAWICDAWALQDAAR